MASWSSFGIVFGDGKIASSRASTCAAQTFKKLSACTGGVYRRNSELGTRSSEFGTRNCDQDLARGQLLPCPKFRLPSSEFRAKNPRERAAALSRLHAH